MYSPGKAWRGQREYGGEGWHSQGSTANWGGIPYIGGVGNEQASLADGTVSNNYALDGLHGD